MLKVGLTGGIGAGKSLVSSVFRKLDIPVYHADIQARRIMVEDTVVKEELREKFGSDLYLNGELNRKYLAGIIFSDPGSREFVNSVVHPAVHRDFGKWAGRQSTEYVIEEAALLFETGVYLGLDMNLLVSAPPEERLRRVMERDNLSRDEVLARMESQMDPVEAANLADIEILNDGHSLLLPLIISADRTIRDRAAGRLQASQSGFN